MPLLTGAIAVLTLAGTPGHPPGSFTRDDPGTPRTYGGPFTRLGALAGPAQVYGSFAGKAASTSDARSVSDTYRLVLTLGDVSEVEARTTDTYVAVLGMSAQGGIAHIVADSYVPILTLGVAALQKSVATDYSGSDSYVPVLTMASAVTVEKSGTDSYVPVLTMGATASPGQAKGVSDSYVPTLGMTALLDTVIGSVTWSLTDTYVPMLTMSATVRVSGDVDRIHITLRPYGRIHLTEH